MVCSFVYCRQHYIPSPTLYPIALYPNHQRYAPSHCIPSPTLAKRPFPDISAPNTSPCTFPDTSPYPETSSCAGGTLSARAALRRKHIQSSRSRKVTASAGKGLSQSKPPSLACAARTFSAAAAFSISHNRLSASNAFSSRFAISASKNDVFPNRALFSPCNAAISLPRSMYKLTVIYSASSSPATAYVKNLVISASVFCINPSLCRRFGLPLPVPEAAVPPVQPLRPTRRFTLSSPS